MSILSERLRELRGEQSQLQMAEPLGMKYQHWAKYERGESAPGAELLAKICRVHSCSADWLLGLSNKPTTITASGPGAVAFIGSHNSFGVPGELASCFKCQYKKRLKTLEKALEKLVAK